MTSQSPSRLLFMLPLLFLMGKIDFEDEFILNSARACFLLMQVISLALGAYIKEKISRENDTTKIYVPTPKKPFSDPNDAEPPAIETTYYEHESAKVKEFLTQTLIGAVISSVIHFKFGVNQVVVFQSVMIPFNLFENPLIKRYILGNPGRVWEELLEGENVKVEDKKGENKKLECTKGKEENKSKKENIFNIGEEIGHAWDSGEDADFDRLFEVVKSNPNSQDNKDGWTALMVACGSPVDTTCFIENIIKENANLTLQDNDGWTALHWCAFHGRPEAAKILLSHSNNKDILNITSNDGKTALELAKTEKNDDVVDIIEEFMTSKKSNSKVEDHLRQRKRFTTATSIGEVD